MVEESTNLNAHSPDKIKHSQDKIKHSPDKIKHSSDKIKHSSDKIKHSSDKIKHSPDKIKHSSDKIKHSPDKIKHSPEKLNYFLHFSATVENRAMANTYKVLAFKNLSNYVVEVTFHNYMDSFYNFDGKDFRIDSEDGTINYRIFYCGQRVKIIRSRPNGTERQLLLKHVFNQDTMFSIQRNGELQLEKVSIEEFTKGCF